jgi:hypothetical protein
LEKVLEPAVCKGISVKRDLISVKRDLITVKRDLISVKRDLVSVIRDLTYKQKRPSEDRQE